VWVEVGAFNRERRAAGWGERVIPGTAVVLGGAPFRLRPTFEKEPLQGRIEELSPTSSASPDIVLRRWGMA
jgi:hypothetical protein